ncbi:Rab effector MyRIP [Dissostichus eleginoides]|uniref:Rab effector MyRIP n=1 Tax=Dissostichus eleginoides TaxID=100907 RepID=A0AAD9BAP8_DISEL|nr:Rab effector MyRIP [Dissostichus eleginoides]
MGRKLDLSGLTDNEAEHVLQVVQRDMRLRKKEEERLSDLKQELDEEGSRCLLLSRQSCFNRRCCIRCCSPFNFLLNPRRPCLDCHFNVCKACRVYSKRDKTWLCSTCQKSRLLKTQSLEWFYTNVKTRFKRFGSAKVLKTLYRKHLAEHNALSELTEGSGYEESICNEGSISGSDSAFYRQIEEHSMAETLTVALRVAEEAIDEAISKAEFDTASQEKQNEALYLREHRGQLVEELSKTIVQKIISRRNTLAEMRAEYDQVWPIENNTDLHHPHHPDCDQASSSIKHQPGLWRSHSAFSLLDNNPAGQIQNSQTLKKEGGTLPTWKSVGRLDNAAVSSVLKSPDGNWIALQSAQLSRPGLLTKRKSPFFSALEREAEVVSAYEGEIHRKMADSNFNLQDGIPFQLPGSRDELFSDSEGVRKPRSLLALFKRKVPAEIRKPASSRTTSIINEVEPIRRSKSSRHSCIFLSPPAEKKREKRLRMEEREMLVMMNRGRKRDKKARTDMRKMRDELDRVGRGEEAEEAMDEEKLWKMQQEHLDVQNTQLRDLASLREEIVGELRESFEDLDVDMFDVMGENEERKTESSDEDVKDQTEVEVKEDCMQERVPAEDEKVVKEDICDEKVEVLEEEAVKKAQGTEGRQEMEFETGIQAEKTEEVILNKAKVQQVDEKVAKRQDKEEVEEKQEEGNINQESPDAETDSDVDDAEFERIISSMLMMTLEDMQAGTLEDEATENRSENIETEDTDESATVGGFEDSAVDARSVKASEETGKELQSRGDVKGNEQTGGDISRKRESEDATGGNENEGEDTDVQEGNVNAAMGETPEVKQTCERIEVDDEEQEGRRGAVLKEGTTMETQEDREVKETDERREETKESVEDMEQSSTSSPHGLLSPEEIQNRYSAVSLCSITTEVLKVLNATEELLLQGGGDGPSPCTPLPPHTDPKKLDQQFSRLEENVYVAAGEVFSLEAELGDLEEVARGVCSDTPGLELSFLEEQVASAAARVQQSELQICDISARIAALKSAGLNVDTQQARFTKTRTVPFMPVTVDSSRQQRRRLPAPPVKEEKEEN